MSLLGMRHAGADLIVELTGLALAAPDVPAAVTPILQRLVERTAADGSAYFEVGHGAGDAFFQARAAAGELPTGPAMDVILAHGLPARTPLMVALEGAAHPLFFDDTALAPEAAGFPALGVASLAAAPVRNAAGTLLGAFLMHRFDAHAWTPSEGDLFASVSGTLANLAARLVAEGRAVAAQERAVRALGLALEHRDHENKGHTDRVTAAAIALGTALGLDESDLHALRWGAYLHDVGKIGIPDAILGKPGRLDPDEWRQMRAHSEIGHSFAVVLEFLPPGALDVIRFHHERWDGTGYPDGRGGEAIPQLARLFAICDVYDALVSERPYKRAWSTAEARDEIRRGAGTQFDPKAVAVFLAEANDGG